jgi:hypothetical protein
VSYQGRAVITAKLTDVHNDVGKIVWSGQRTNSAERPTAAQAIEAAVAEGTYEITRQIYPFFPIRGIVLKVEGDKIYTDLGNQAGVAKNDKLTLMGVTNTMTHPITGKTIEIVGIMGTLKVLEAHSDFSTATLEKKGKDQQKVYPGDTVSRELKKKPRNMIGQWTGGRAF